MPLKAVSPEHGSPQHLRSVDGGQWTDKPPPLGSTGGGSGGSYLEPRIAKLESDVGHIQSDISEIKQDVRDIRNDGQRDFRILFGSLIVAAIGLAWLMAVGFKWIPW